MVDAPCAPDLVRLPAQVIASLLRANKDLDPDSVAAIDDILQAAMRLAGKRVRD